MSFLPDEKVMCHNTGFEKSCLDMVVRCKCRKWLSIDCINANTGEKFKEYKCADEWYVHLLMENSQQQRQTGAAVESFRNETVKGTREAQQFMAAALMNHHPQPPAILIEDRS